MRDRDSVEEFLVGRPSEDAELERVAAALQRGESPEPSAALLRTTEQRVRAELRNAAQATLTRRPLVERSGAGALRLTLAIALPTILCLSVQVFLLGVVAPWLASLLPGPIAWVVVGGYVLASAVWFGLFWLALPLLAYAHQKLSSPQLAIDPASGPTAS